MFPSLTNQGADEGKALGSFAMFAKIFQKSLQQEHPQRNDAYELKLFDSNSGYGKHNVVQGSSTSAYLNPQVFFHYGVPATASILAFDYIQSLLAVGTLDGRIKVFGGDNIEGILISPKQSTLKNLEFLQNQGFLVSVSNDNEIQVWDLERRQIASALRWESTITAFSVIYGSSYMYIGSEHGMVFVLKFNLEDRKLDILPYYVPTNVIAEAVRMSLDNVSVVRVLHQPGSQGNRLLIAYENGLIVLWDASEDQIVLVRGHRDLELKEKKVSSCPNDINDEPFVDKSDHKEEKEISSLCWASNDGSVIAVGYIDGDIMLWDLSTASTTVNQQAQNLPSLVVKLQLSSADRRLPIIVLHWRANNSNKIHGGQLFVYGGDEIGSEEVLSVLSLDWSSGIESLKCTGRVDITLHGSFADMVLLSDCPEERDCNMLYVLTNPGQLHLYDGAHLSSLTSQQGKKTFVPGMLYPMVIPTIEPYMTTAKLGVVHKDSKSFGALSEIVLAANKNAVHNQKSSSIKSPLTGGVPVQILKEDHHVYRIYIAGYQDGSVRIWDATYPALSLVYHIKSEVNDIKIDGANAPVSALEFCTDTLQLAVGNECGVVRLYGLIRNSGETTIHIVTENKTEVQNLHQGDGSHCTAVFSVLSSAVCTLNFANLGGKLAVGYECGQVAMFDISTSSILFLTSTGSDKSSPVISLDVKLPGTGSSTNIPRESVSNTLDSGGKGLVFIMSADARIVAIDMSSGNMICTRSMNPKKGSNVISMHIIDGTFEVSSENISNSFQNIDSRKELLQANIQSESTPVEVETANTVEMPYLEQISLNSLVLLCYESELSLHSLKSVIEDCSKYIRKVNLVKRCCWTTTFKKDEKECGLVVLYQTGDIELRSLPTLEVVGESSLMSILRWNLKTNMEKTICSSSNGQIILVNGNEAAFISLLNNENEFRILESLPCLHDKVLAAAVNSTASLSPSQNEKQGARGPAMLIEIIKNLKLGKAEQNANQAVHVNNSADLERLFSCPPFLKPDKQNSFDLDIDEIHIDEPAAVSSSQKSDKENKDKGKGTERQKLLEDESYAKPRLRTAEEIKTKYRKAGTNDAAAAAALARDKLAERQEKLERLSKNTEELQSGAQDFASMASQLAKRMENRKWWQL